METGSAINKKNIIDEFLNHAPKMVCDFEKAILGKNHRQVIFLSKLNRTLFHQIGEHEIANEFDEFTETKKYNLTIVNELVKSAKQLISQKESELGSLQPFEPHAVDSVLEINLDQLISLKDSSPNFVFEIIDLYGQQNIDYLLLMHNAIKRHDFEKVRKIAHTMKSSFVMIGCKILKNIAIELEVVCECEKVNYNRLTELFEEFDIHVKDSIHLLKNKAKAKNLL